MLTRKRVRDESLHVNYATHNFDPVLEAVARFLRFVDCASVASVDRRLYAKTWLYVLDSASRAQVCNDYLFLDEEHQTWITKFSNHLQNMTVSLMNDTHKFEELTISRCIACKCTTFTSQFPSAFNI
jgi:hypothetical protein